MNTILWWFLYAYRDVLNFYFVVILVAMATLSEISYFILFLSNPGLPPQSMNKQFYEANKEKLKISSTYLCKYCNIMMNEDIYTKHCDDCGVCIESILLFM
jgi:hypothetical protein